MKVAIMTFVRAYNYGAVLQAYALNKVINDMGVDCETIDYYPKYFYDEYHMKNNKIRVNSHHVKAIIGEFVWNIKFKFKLQKRCMDFRSFIRSSIKLSSKKFINQKQLRKATSNYDLFISGSDQVWNNEITRNDYSFLLDFVKTNTIKASYAASFGKINLIEQTKEIYINNLSSFSYLSIRDNNSQMILNSLIGTDGTLCCDPTILLEINEWKSVAKNTNYKERYILVYYVKKDDQLFDIAKALSQKMKLHVVFITSTLDNDIYYNTLSSKYGFINGSFCSPKGFINRIMNAEYVITNSFHGTVFSLIFHKNFYSKYMNVDNSVDERIFNLLKAVEVLDYVNNVECPNNINWNKVDKIMNNIRKDSLDYIHTILME